MARHLKNHIHHIDKRLQFRLRLYVIIAVVLIGVVIFNMLAGRLRLEYGIVGIIAGAGVGIITSRMFHTSWDKNAKKVISRLDTFGIGILLLYIAFELLRSSIVTFFTHDVQVATTGLAVLAGIMIGRVIGTRGKIIEVLKEQKIFG